MTLPQPIIDLYDRFTHGGMDRRTFLDRLATLAGGAPAAAALLPLLAADPAKAAIVPADDPRLTVGRVTWAGPDGELAGYLVAREERDFSARRAALRAPEQWVR